MFKRSIIVAFVAMLFPVLLFSEMNPNLKMSPAMEKLKVKPIEIDRKLLIKKLNYVKKFTYLKDSEWKYRIDLENPKNIKLKAIVYGVYPNNNTKKLEEFKTSNKSIEKRFNFTTSYKALKVDLFEPNITANNQNFNVSYKKVDTKYVSMPNIKAEIISLSYSKSPKSWTYSVKNTSAFPMEFNIHFSEFEGDLQHKLNTVNTPTIGVNKVYTKNGTPGYYRSGNRFEVSVLNNTGVPIAKKSIAIE